VRQELTKYGVIPEEWGGENIFVPVFGEKPAGCRPAPGQYSAAGRSARVEAPTTGSPPATSSNQSREGRGAIATVLVAARTLKLGDPLLIGQEFGACARCSTRPEKPIDAAGRPFRWWCLGLSGAPNAAMNCWCRKRAQGARGGHAPSIQIPRRQAGPESANMQDVFSTMGENKADLSSSLQGHVQGSVEALRDALNALSTGEVAVNIVASGVGDHESDITWPRLEGAHFIVSTCAAIAAARTASRRRP